MDEPTIGRPPTSANVLTFWTIFRSPEDYPGLWVLRRTYAVLPHRLVKNDPIACLGESLEQLRAGLPPGLYNLGRMEPDVPSMVETWI